MKISTILFSLLSLIFSILIFINENKKEDNFDYSIQLPSVFIYKSLLKFQKMIECFKNFFDLGIKQVAEDVFSIFFWKSMMIATKLKIPSILANGKMDLMTLSKHIGADPNM